MIVIVVITILIIIIKIIIIIITMLTLIMMIKVIIVLTMLAWPRGVRCVRHRSAPARRHEHPAVVLSLRQRSWPALKLSDA